MHKKLTEQGLRFLEAGQFEKAAQILSLLVKSFPEHADAHHMLGVIELERGNFEAAYKLVKTALELMPDNSVFYNTLGNIEVHRQNYTLAEQAFLQAIKYNPEKIEYKYNLAHFYLSRGEYQKAIDFYYYILHHNPTHYLSIRGITVCYLFSNEASIALEHAREWVKEFGSYDEPYYYLGLCYYALNDLSAALRTYDKGLNINPNNYEILTAIGACYKGLGNQRIAESYFLKSISLESNNPTAMYNLANVYMDNNDLDAARKLFMNAISLDPNYADPICGLGNIELIKHDDSAALKYFATAHIAEPQNPKPGYLTATTLLRTQDFARGWQALRATINTPTLIDNIRDWSGERLSQDQALLVWIPKDGYDIGNQIMFASLLSRLHNYSKKIILLCDQSIECLLKRSFPTMTVVHELDVYNLQTRFSNIAFHAPITTLAQLFIHQASDFAPTNQIEYLQADLIATNDIRQKYHALFPQKKLVGIAWKSIGATGAVDHLRSSNLHDWEMLFGNKDCQFIALQSEPDSFVPKNLYFDSEMHAKNLASQIDSMDLIISMDNNISHIAGGLGKLVYTLIPMQSAWYWFKNLPQSLWYPHLYLFRQSKPNSWQEVISNIKKML